MQASPSKRVTFFPGKTADCNYSADCDEYTDIDQIVPDPAKRRQRRRHPQDKQDIKKQDPTAFPRGKSALHLFWKLTTEGDKFRQRSAKRHDRKVRSGSVTCRKCGNFAGAVNHEVAAPDDGCQSHRYIHRALKRRQHLTSSAASALLRTAPATIHTRYAASNIRSRIPSNRPSFRSHSKNSSRTDAQRY